MEECGNKKSINKPLDIFKFQNGVTVIRKFSQIIKEKIVTGRPTTDYRYCMTDLPTSEEL